MPNAVQKLFDRVSSWPQEDVDMLEDAARQIEALRSGQYEATAAELHAIDEAIAELESGKSASPDDIRAAFAAFHAG